MSVIVLLGGHGVGKSTAVRRWKGLYPQLEIYPLDDMRKAYYNNEAKVALVNQLQLSRTIGVVETAKGYSALAKSLASTDPVIIVAPASPELGRQWMEERKGKPLTAWWGPDQLRYELIERFVNFATKHLNPSQVRRFILGVRSDWDEVDQYFYRLFMCLHNQTNRKRHQKHQ